jgi:radical SAM protein with 4Fe4S-binding SPASM domain
MCGQRGVKGVLKGQVAQEEAKTILPLSAYEKLIDQVKGSNPMFYLWGGEPFLYPDLMELGRMIVGRGQGLSLNTNGTFLEEHAEEIVRDKWSAIFVSMDGFEEINDQIRGKNSYARAMAGIAAIGREKKKQKSSLPNLGIVSVVNNINYLHMGDLVKAGQNYDLSWHIINLGTYTNDKIVAENKKFYQDHLGVEARHLEAYNTGYNQGIDGQKFYRILTEIHALKSKYPIITVPAIRPQLIQEYYSIPDRPLQGYCPVPWSQVNIRYNGDVHFCADYPDYVIGNITQDDFFTIFNSDRANRFREELKKTECGIFPGCLRCYQNMLLGRLLSKRFRKEK